MSSFHYDVFTSLVAQAVREFVSEGSSPRTSVCTFTPEDASRLSRDLRANSCAFLVRRLLEYLHFDESLAFRFRVDHKLVQGVLLKIFAPSAALDVIGLAEAVRRSEGPRVEDYLRSRYPRGFVLKDVYGYNSGRKRVLMSSSELDRYTSMPDGIYDGRAVTERCFVQEKFNATTEYRVHSLGRAVIPTLIYRTHGSLEPLGSFEKESVSNFVSETIALLPEALISQCLCGWDIGLEKTGVYKVFEINYSGCHPVFEPGFHCSAYFQSDIDSSLNTAKLLHFVAKERHVHFEIDENLGSNPLEVDAAAFLHHVKNWLHLLEVAADAHCMWEDSYKKASCYHESAATVTSVRRLIDANAATQTERAYCQYLDWLRAIFVDLR